ncbi:protein translocase subunit SecF [Alishewanella longhuensis]
MLNQNPLWRYLLVVGVLLLALVYALPNLYPEDPALNINATRGGAVSETTRQQLEEQLVASGITPKAVTLENGQVLVRFQSAEDQLRGRQVATELLGNVNYVTALNLVPTTPAWLAAIGASPMKLGLDLRGGVHFLMAVDMKAALDKNINDLTQAFRADLREARVRYRSVSADLERSQVQVLLRSAEDVVAARAALSKLDREYVFTDGAAEFSLNVSLSGALIGILLYVGMRFEWRLSVGAVLALGHDVIITLGLFSLLQLEFDLTVLAAILALIGYSINDTIVVFDRIRESFRKLRDATPEETVNDAVTATLNRTVVTSLTTIIVLVVLFYMGGALIHNFATALLFGIAIGTYSSVFVASGIAVQLGLNREDMLPPPPPEKEGEGTEPLL